MNSIRQFNKNFLYLTVPKHEVDRMNTQLFRILKKEPILSNWSLHILQWDARHAVSDTTVKPIWSSRFKKLKIFLWHSEQLEEFVDLRHHYCSFFCTFYRDRYFTLSWSWTRIVNVT